MFELRSMPALPTLYLRQTLPAADLARFCRDAFNELSRYQRTQTGAAPRSFYSLCQPLPAGQIECEAGCLMPSTPLSSNGLLVGHIPAGVYACGVHRGPYDQLGACHAALLSWAKSLAYYPHGSAYEWFCRDLQHLPAEIRTEIWLPVEPARSLVVNVMDERVFLA